MASKSDGVPESIDLEALGIDHLAGHARAATFAPNWKSVLAADGFIGLLIVALGVAVIVWWIDIVGWLIVIAGVGYCAGVGRRAMQWRYLRQKAGLS